MEDTFFLNRIFLEICVYYIYIALLKKKLPILKKIDNF